MQDEKDEVQNEDIETPIGDVNSIADTLAQNMPEVQEHVIETHREREETKHLEYVDLKDSDGNSFDPAIHKTNKEGEPTLSPKGKLIKKPKSKQGKTAPKSNSIIGGAGKKSEPKDPDEVLARASGKMAGNMLITLGMVVGGEEWAPMKNEEYGVDEKELLENAFGDYFVATGRKDIPPAMALTIAVSSYALPRFTMPKTKKRVGGVVGWFKKLWINRKLKKHGLKVTETDTKAD